MCGVTFGAEIECWGNQLRMSDAPAACGTLPCLTDNGGCDPLTQCTDSRTGPTCTDCPDGYTGNGATGCKPLYKSISAAGLHTCAITTVGTVVCSGDDSHGEIEAPSGTFSDVAAGSTSTCGIRTDGTIACWGLIDGQLPAPPSGTFSKLSRGNDRHYCATPLTSGTLCWGANDIGQSTPPNAQFDNLRTTGNRSMGMAYDPTTGSYPLMFWGEPGFTKANIGAYSAGLGTDYYCSVSRAYNDVLGRVLPVDIQCTGAYDGTPQVVLSGQYSTLTVYQDTFCALGNDGYATCLGDSSFGKTSPPPTRFTDITLATRHGCGLRPDHHIECWGDSQYFFQEE